MPRTRPTASRNPGRRPARPNPTVTEVLATLDRLAPLANAADWDNVGLLAGWSDATVRRVLLTVDLTDAVAREAMSGRADLVVAYHPPILKGIRAITAHADAPTTLLPDLLGARISVISLHTALDAANGGTNDVLLDAFDPVERWPLSPLVQTEQHYKLVVFVPPEQADKLRAALSAAGAGVIGHYDECSYELAGRGTFRGDETTNPTIGQRGVLERVAETRLEMIVPRGRLGPAVRALYAAHSYEEPAFDLYPLHELAGRGGAGMGRVGRLRRPLRGVELLRQLAARVDTTGASAVGDLRRRFSSVTAAAGAFGVREFCDPDSLVLTGEFRHHDALQLLRRGITAIHLGHWASERPALDLLRRHLRRTMPGLRVALSKKDRSPFVPAM